ncbi:unnamed protein product [Arabidopsis thaliana]|uniref:(thale cress) hypothetical protein n=1 Tax=Arabidopsis thaliana TaxID=3702 RepID=A0A7G2FG67_ARATH|nr:unnamed protein product [Arabidopsis thaliana]
MASCDESIHENDEMSKEEIETSIFGKSTKKKDNGGAGGSGSKLSKKVRSWVWDHFTKLSNDVNHCNCNYCGKELACSTKSGTSTLKKHLLNICKAYQIWKAANVQNTQTVLTHGGPSGCMTISKRIGGIKRVFCIIVDNATANTSAMTKFKKEMMQLNGNDALILKCEYLHMRCAAHILNLVVKEGLTEINSSVEAIRNGIQIGPTVTKDWENIERLVQILEIFYKCTLVISASNYVASHKLYNEIVSITRNLGALKYDDALKDKTEAMLAKLGWLYGKGSVEATHLQDSVYNILSDLFDEYTRNNLLNKSSSGTARLHNTTNEVDVYLKEHVEKAVILKEHELGETGFDFNSECDTKVSHGVMVSRRGSEGLCYLVVLFVGLVLPQAHQKWVYNVENILHIRFPVAAKLTGIELNSYNQEYNVIDLNSVSFLVDLKMKTCSCKHFDIDKMPCVHAIAATRHLARKEGRNANI